MKHIIVLCSLFFTTFFAAKASHISSADISYEYITGNTYKVKLTLYRDCQGIALGTSEIINIASVSTAQTTSLTVNQVSTGQVQNFCATVATNCSNVFSSFPGFEYTKYEGTITLPNTANDWVFSWSTCCRSAAIVNLSNAVSNSATVITTLNNSNPVFNNSPVFTNDAIMIFATNQTYTYNFGSIDPDGDSIHYSLVTPLDIPTTNCVFNVGFTAANPFGISNATSINGSNGNITFTSNSVGLYAFAVQTDEYRNGILIATSIRDINIQFVNNTVLNALPTLSGINGTTANYTSINLCASSSFNFTIIGSDADVADSVYIEWNNTIAGATLTSNGAQQATATFSWTPTAADIRPQPYIVTFKARDNKCPFPGKQSFGYLLYVNQCNTDSVWAGDANADFTVNNYDVLNIGIGNGFSGVVRPSATTTWQAEYCSNWANSFLSNINYKHADCNGDGTINSADLTAVTANYGQFHLKKNNYGSYKTAAFPSLVADVSGINAYKGSTIAVPIKLGDVINTMNNFYGIAGTVEVKNGIASLPINITNTTSWIGNASSSILFQKNTTNEKLDFTIVRNNQTAVSGNGQIATLHFPISNSMVVGTKVKFMFSNLRLINALGETIQDYNTIHDSVTILAPLALSTVLQYSNAAIFPNPASSVLLVNLGSNYTNNTSVTLTDITGNIILQKKIAYGTLETQIDVTSLTKGMYFVHVQSQENTQVLKFEKN